MLELGADACVSKPVNAKEIFAIVRAVYRRESRLARLQRGKLLPRIEHKKLKIDPFRRIVMMRRDLIELTAKEFDVLYFLAYHAGTVMTKKEIYESVWKETYDETSTGVADHISSLRRKLGFYVRVCERTALKEFLNCSPKFHLLFSNISDFVPCNFILFCVMIKLSKEGDAPGQHRRHLLLHPTIFTSHVREFGGGIYVVKKKGSMIFADYPDVVNVEQMCSMLGGIGKKTAYDLLRNGDIRHIKLGKSFKIPKVCVIEYLIGDTQKVSP